MPNTSSIQPRRLRRESLARIALAAAVTATLVAPNAPGWTVATHPAFYVVAAVYLIWNAVLAILSHRGKPSLAGFSESSIALDALLLTALVHFTGGGFSPFLLLILPMVFGLYLSAGGRSALAGAVVVAACSTAWGAVVLRFVSVPPAFHVLGEPYVVSHLDNLVYLGTTAGLAAVVIALASTLVMVLAQRSARLARELRLAEQRREAADRELADSLRRLEQLSTVSNRMADVLRLLGQNQPPGGGAQYRH